MVADYFLSQGNTVNVYVTKRLKREDAGMAEFPNLKIHCYETNHKLNLLYLFFTLLRNRKITYDYAFTSFVQGTSMIGILRKLHILKIKYFVGRESTSIFQRKDLHRSTFEYKLWYRLGYSAVDLLICQTEYMKKQLLGNLPWLEKKVNVQVIPNPVNLNDMFEKAKEELDSSIDKPFIVSAGRLISVKGFDILIKVFAKLKQNYPELKLIILGNKKNAACTEKLKQIIKKLNLEDDVILYGNADNVYPFFKNAKMCVVSSRIEGFPNVLLQMMSQNEKVVSTLCAGGIDEIDGLFTCKTNDDDDLLRAMTLCLEADTTKNRKLFDAELQNRSIDKFVERIKSMVLTVS
jgi:glycosyltransferase involved in cell wall biosynthesis